MTSDTNGTDDNNANEINPCPGASAPSASYLRQSGGGFRSLADLVQWMATRLVSHIVIAAAAAFIATYAPLGGWGAVPQPSQPPSPSEVTMSVVVAVDKSSSPSSVVRLNNRLAQVIGRPGCPIILHSEQVEGVVSVLAKVAVISSDGGQSDVVIDTKLGARLGLKPGQSARLSVSLPPCE